MTTPVSLWPSVMTVVPLGGTSMTKKSKLVYYGDPLLKQECHIIESFTERVDNACIELTDRCVELDGAGLAAPQLGIGLQIFVSMVPYKNYEGEETFPGGVCINPSWEPNLTRGTEYLEKEGCLSAPDCPVDVLRWDCIDFSYMNLLGEEHSVQVEGYAARVIQHECDHLEGKCIVDLLSRDRRRAVARRLRKLRQSQ